MSRRFRRRPPWWTLAALLVGAAVVLRGKLFPQANAPVLPPGPVQAIAVIDGRTLLVRSAPDGPPITVRLLGLRQQDDDSSARAWLETHVVGRTLRIALDNRRLDRDGASLAYVYLDDTFVNAELIRVASAEYAGYPGDSASHARRMREAKETFR